VLICADSRPPGFALNSDPPVGPALRVIRWIVETGNDSYRFSNNFREQKAVIGGRRFRGYSVVLNLA
jgi:hypothetical protein